MRGTVVTIDSLASDDDGEDDEDGCRKEVVQRVNRNPSLIICMP